MKGRAGLSGFFYAWNQARKKVSWYMNPVYNKAHKMDEIAIKSKIRGKGTLKDRAKKLPPMGVKIKGVSAAMPLIPNFCQIWTA